MDINLVVSRFEAVKPTTPGQWLARCPNHEDSHASLCIGLGDKGAVIKCQAGCATESVLKKVGLKMSDLFFDEPNKESYIVKEYDYLDADGRLLYQAVRMEPKAFRQRRPDPENPGEWLWSTKGIERVIYRLPGILDACQKHRPVVIVEGEKDADSVFSLGLDATTNVGGAGKWRPEYSAVLAGANVIIIPDRDEPGRAHGVQVALSLKQIAATVKVIDGGTVADLQAMIAAAPIWEPPTEKPTTDPAVIDSGAYPLDDSGQADLFELVYRNKIKYDHKRSKWFVWRPNETSGGRWDLDETGEITRLARIVADIRLKDAETAPESTDGQRKEKKQLERFAKQARSLFGLQAATKLAGCHEAIAVDGSGWDRNSWLLGVKNGVIDLKTGKLMKNQHDLYITKYCNVDYNGMYETPKRWTQFMSEIFGGDEKLVGYVQRALGYSLTAETNEQCYFMFYGTGGNGKSTLFGVIRDILGPYTVNLPFTAFELNKSPSIPSDLAMLPGARLLTALEPSSNSRLDPLRIKTLSGEDAITARRLYENEFTFKPSCKMWFSVNTKPNIYDDTNGFWRRVRLIALLQQFNPNMDKRLKEILASEYSQILSWMVLGCIEWQAVGLLTPPEIVAYTDDYRADQDPFGQFIKEEVILDTNEKIKVAHLYSAYKNWAEKEGYSEKEIFSRVSFARKMGNRYPRKHFVSGDYFMGIRTNMTVIQGGKTDSKKDQGFFNDAKDE
jgi:putative DNA primase/helicase